MYFFVDIKGYLFYIAVIFLIGIGYIALTPPWEGYDEIAHYSYTQQIADTGFPIRNGIKHLSLDVEKYHHIAPTPYITVRPLDISHGRITYKSWFESKTSNYSFPHRKQVINREYKPGIGINWQAQHPPLYYIVLAPLVRITADKSWITQLFILRVASWTMVTIGLMLILVANHLTLNKLNPNVVKPVLMISVTWPLLFPGFFPEFARLGNDSLVILLMSLVWLLVVMRTPIYKSWWWFLAIGIVLGLGGLTKITFIPIAFGIFIWIFWLNLFIYKKNQWITLIKLLMTIFVFFAIVGNFYLTNFLDKASMTGLVELSQVNKSSFDLIISIFHHPVEVLRGLAGMAMTFAWGGSTSSAYPPAIFVLPLLLPVFFLLPCAYFGIRKFNIDAELPILALLITGSVFGGLLYYLLARISITGYGSGAPGWYFHVLLGPLSLLFGIGLAWFRSKVPGANLLCKIVLVYATVFSFCIWILQAAMFTGCIYKSENSNKYTAFDWGCLFDFSTMYSRLSLLASPGLGIFLLCFSILMILVSLIIYHKQIR